MPDFFEPPSESRSLELVARIQRGDDDAWTELYHRYHDQLLFAVRMRLGAKLRGRLASEDIFQSVATDALRALLRFEYRGPGSLERFLTTMIANKIRDRADTFGAEKRAGEVSVTDSALGRVADESSATYHDAETYERLERALDRLPDDLREVLLLRKVDGLSSREVAERLRKTDAAVRKATSRALARLSALMGGDGEAPGR